MDQDVRGRVDNKKVKRESEREEGEREKEKKKDTRDPALMEQRYFSDFSVSIYKL